jgi:hypothetical protein
VSRVLPLASLCKCANRISNECHTTKKVVKQNCEDRAFHYASEFRSDTDFPVLRTDISNNHVISLAKMAASVQATKTDELSRRWQVRACSGLGQLSLVEHALCPLDPKSSLKTNLAFDANYYFTDKNHHQKTAHAQVLCPLGLSAVDELYLWGLLALTFSQAELNSELHATPHYCLRQLGVIDHESRRGGRQYAHFADAIERLSAVTYRNSQFYDPIRGEHRRMSFGFLSYSLPLDPHSSRAWRISWDPIFMDLVSANGGGMRFDFAMYRELDPASRRLFLFVSKVFARRETTPRLNVRHLAKSIIGFSNTLDTKLMKVKVARIVHRLVECEMLEPCAELFRKHGKGDYSLTLTRGPYFTRRNSAGSRSIRESPLLEPLVALGFETSSANYLIRQFPQRLLQEWTDITLAAKERFGDAFFKKSPQAYLVDNLKNAATGQRTQPDWWHDLRKAEYRKEPGISALASQAAGQPKNPPSVDGESEEAFQKIRDDLFGHFLAAGHSERGARGMAERFAREHMGSRTRPSTGGLTKVKCLLPFSS